MADYLIQDTTLTKIADAVRKGTEISIPLSPRAMTLIINTWLRTEGQAVEEISFRTTETEGLPVITDSEGTAIWYKISSLTPSINDIIGSIVTSMTFEEGIEIARRCEVIEETDVTESELWENYFSVFPLDFYTEDTEINGIIFEKGIYVREGAIGDAFLSLKWKKKIDIFPLQIVEGFTSNELFGAYISSFVSPPQFTLEEGQTYYVEWDKEETYTCKAYKINWNGMEIVYIGNGSSMGYEGNGEPFAITYNITQNGTQMMSDENLASHIVRIYQNPSTNIELTSLSVTENGTYIAPEGIAYSQVDVEVEGGKEIEIDVFPFQTVEGFASNEEFMGLYIWQTTPAPFSLTIGQTYFVEWDETTWECAAQDASALISGAVGLGDLTLAGGSGKGEPFVVGYMPQADFIGFISFDQKTEHTIRIYQKASANIELMTSLSVTENGTYTAPEGVVYSSIIANVPSVPIEVSTEAEMTELLESGEVGGVYKYTGENTDIYENGALYVLEGVTLEGTWVFNDTSMVYANGLAAETIWYVNFVMDALPDVQFTALAIAEVSSTSDQLLGLAALSATGEGDYLIYHDGEKYQWGAGTSMTITSTIAEVENGDTLLAWLQANATKQ